MNILVTGAKGFIGQNLIYRLQNLKADPNRPKGLEIDEILEFDIDTDPAQLKEMTKRSDFVFHLAGVNRPENPDEFMKGNFGFTSLLLDALESQGNNCPVMISSSIQAALDNDYGKSKKSGEDLLFEYGKRTGANILVYRFSNVFGKWSRPNYNSAVATFCYNIARGLPITVNDPEVTLRLNYIDDVVEELINALSGHENRDEPFCAVPIELTIKLGKLSEMLYSFKEARTTLEVPDQSNSLTRNLYATYQSFLPQDDFSYPLTMHKDHRGSFSEFIHTPERGQVSVNVAKAGIIKGNHWHDTKNEKFLVVSGQGVIRFRHILTNEVVEYQVSGDHLVVVDIPPGYTHQIQNVGQTDLVTLMWANDVFDPSKPDTYFSEV